MTVTDFEPLSILLLARSLETGGAERQLVELALGLKKRGHEVRVALFYGGGALEGALRTAGVEILDLRKSGRWDFAGFLVRTVRVFRRLKPNVIYSFLGGGNIVGGLVRPFAGRTKLVWSVLNSAYDLSVDHWLARVGHVLETALARTPDAIIANSSAGRAFAVQRGFPAKKVAVVPNGIDTERFRPDSALRREQRRKLGLGDDEIAIGVLARLNATKDYPTFLRAAAEIAPRTPRARFLCVGSGSDLDTLQRLASGLGISDRVQFTGELDAAMALNAFDIACSTSVTEGFSNAIAEAMACGLPCIVTDVGDSALIVGDCGVVVPPSSPGLLAQAIEQVLRRLDDHDPSKPRQRIADEFSLDKMVDRTIEVFRQL
jgi:glycosyltransferase involved in cell wall biosynthesis